MFATTLESRSKRRGIVLVLVLGMLALMALIGVTFATFAGQALINARNFGQGVGRPQADTLMDYALAQLINDTNNPLSALRGHSLLRDMYGNDSVFRGATPTINPASETGGFFTNLSINGVGPATSLQITGIVNRINSTTSTTYTPTPFYNQIQYRTNIPTSGPFYGLDFTRWILKVPGNKLGNGGSTTINNIPNNGFAAQTFEILEDDATSTDGLHHFTLSNNLSSPSVDPNYITTPPQLVAADWPTFNYLDPNYMSPASPTNTGTPPYGVGTANAPAYTFVKSYARLSPEWAGTPFILDGRNMRAFNGPGWTGAATNTPLYNSSAVAPYDTYPYNLAAYANFRIISGVYPYLNPDNQGMDEDYDACDLENWYLALQSADGAVVIPSFHRPGILTNGGTLTLPDGKTTLAIPSDWSASATPQQRSKILRPRQIDNSPLFPTDPSVPNADGSMTYDIDNDGDGITDSVWIDLGYPVQRDPKGKLSKPLFAFMVLGLNGRLPLNTVGNLQARANADQTNNAAATLPAPLPLSTGQVPQPGIGGDGFAYKASAYNNAFPSGVFTSSQTYLDAPLWDHTSHLGYSVNEINPKFALQNAPSNVINYQTYTTYNAGDYPYNGNNHSQVDDAGVSVALTQLRNILAGTIPSQIPFPYSTYPYTAASVPYYNGTGYAYNSPPLPITGMTNPVINSVANTNGDVNTVIVDGKMMILPNNMADPNDINVNGYVSRFGQAVAGRWGEPFGIQLNSAMPPPGDASTPYNAMTYPGLYYNNPVRAGRSVISGLTGTPPSSTNDIMDDDFDGTDPLLAQYLAATLYYNEPSSTSGPTVAIPARIYPEWVDAFDTVGQRAIASERIRQFVTPIDPGGVGRVVSFMNRPNNDYDYGNGYDSRGRTSYFRYFRTPGMPQEIRYPYGGVGSTYPGYPFYSPYTSSSISANFMGQRFLMPQLFPAGQSTAATQLNSGPSDIHNNRYHGYQSMLTPEIASASTASPPTYLAVTSPEIAAMGAMPYDWDISLNSGSGGIPIGYPQVVSTMPPSSTLAQISFAVNLYTPTINPFIPGSAYVANPISTSVNSSWGPNLGIIGNPGATLPTLPAMPSSPPLSTNTPPTSSSSPIYYGQYANATDNQPIGSPVVNGYLGGGLNKDEADEMNLYFSNRYDQPYGPSDLEWLYRLQDVDGSTLSSRLSQLAPVSFIGAADAQTRRRLFSTDSWEPTGFVYANDNPVPYAGVIYGASTDHNFSYNSRFAQIASPSLENMNQIAYTSINGNTIPLLANPITTEYLPNPTFPMYPALAATDASDIHTLFPNSHYATGISLPTAYGTASQILSASVTNNVVHSYGNNSMVQVQTPSLSHRDRKINLNMPLPISHDPAEPVRQKWCRETYQMLKAILPPAAVDTPEELAALSQFVVNIIDFRDPDPAMTRFVNTDLIVTDVLTRTASNVQPTATPTPPALGYDTNWNVSPAGVRFATSADAVNLISYDTATPPNPIQHFPYDPGIYNPDATTPYLVQHGMEYNPIAINEVLGFQTPVGTPATTVQCLAVELVNTLTEEQNNNGSNNNASSISLTGWDMVLAPDNYGWGRPDPISGDVSSIAFPPKIPPVAPATMATLPPANQAAPLSQVKNYVFGGNTVKAINAGSFNPLTVYAVTAGGYTVSTGATPASTNLPTSATNPTLFLPTYTKGTGEGQYFWLYLRRPANPFDTAALSATRPNREMVVVDAMRFPYIDLTPVGTGTSKSYSSRRLQPYRGGHLVFPNTVAGAPGANTATTIAPPSPPYAYGYSEQMRPTTSTQSITITTTATPPVTATVSAMSSIGSEGTPKDSVWANFPFNDRDFTSVAELLLVPGCPPGLFTKQFIEEPYPGNIVGETTVVTSVTPPSGGKITTSSVDTYNTTYATGSDDINPVGGATTKFVGNGGKITAPVVSSPPSSNTNTTSGTTTTTTTNMTFPYGGRTNFNQLTSTGPTPVAPTYPYLPDNFYYTASPVGPSSPPPANVLPNGMNNFPTEVGGWTGNGWHKMMEFFEVPTSANGAIGTADGVVPNTANSSASTANIATNFDWARSDVRPGLINLNLLIDEEVFAGLFDDPRLNEQLALLGPANTTIPQIVNLVDVNGYAISSYPIFNMKSVNYLNQLTTTPVTSAGFSQASPATGVGYYNNSTNNPSASTLNYGRGYVVKDSDSQNYVLQTTVPTNFPYQQLHGLKAAFSDFLKLRHGGSGFLFAHGAGPTGSGDVYINGWPQTQPIAADRPYRSLSYPDINYTIMRPASLPPSPVDSIQPGYRYSSTSPPLPPGLSGLFTYGINTPANPSGNTTTYLGYNPFLAPMNLMSTDTPIAGPFQYVADPGVKNPFLAIQYAYPNNPRTATTATTYPIATAPATGTPYPGPPYPAFPYVVQAPATTFPTPQAAPFPPPIPPTPARRLMQIPDIDTSTALTPALPSSNASLSGSYDAPSGQYAVNNPPPAPTPPATTSPPPPNVYSVNQQVTTLMLFSGGANPPTLFPQTRAVFLQDNNTPQPSTTSVTQTSTGTGPPTITVIAAGTNNFLGAGNQTNGTTGLPPGGDYRQHPLYRTELLQKLMNLSTVRTHQYAVWITIGFFEVIQPGTPELGIPDILGQEVGLSAGKNIRYRSFFTLDRTKAAGFNPYYPGNFRDCVTYRRRIE